MAILSRPQRVSVTGAGEDVSDGEGVVATFFLIRYQTAVASSTDINFARQFSRVSLARRTESNFARQFFEVSLFIIAVRQNFRDALTKRLRSEIALNSPPMANGNGQPLRQHPAKTATTEPNRILSPSFNSTSVIKTPLTCVPFVESKSFSR